MCLVSLRVESRDFSHGGNGAGEDGEVYGTTAGEVVRCTEICRAHDDGLKDE